MSEQRMRTNDRVKNRVWVAAALAAAGATCVAGVSQPTAADPGQKELTEAVTAFLGDHGDLCMAKYTWPRDVTPGDESTDRNDAVQLPVLERLGVVRSVEIPVPSRAMAVSDTHPAAPASSQPGASSQTSQLPPAESTRRYSLTEKGQQYYLKKKHTIIGPHDLPTEHDADFCVAHLTLDKVVKWSPPEPVHNRLQTVVRYTYHVKAADWMSDPDAQKVFPIVDRIIRGDGSRMMSATVALEDGKWVPVLPVH
jgi:hypothetical protein